ncbi:MAG: N-6 DNA methylase [Verrucomicrobia bacterium]|jgi:hypothetical protein|nr:N-6 DNA methylase [Verrucomicrobiota bacterium]
MMDIAPSLREFVDYASRLEGYEKGEAQIFCERLFQAFGHPGLKEIGAHLEFKIPKRRERGTKFADLLWRPRVLIEMKSRGERLEKHFRQAFDYWIELVPDRPKYVVLCNFDEFWIYDFNVQLDSPVDRVLLDELPDRYTAFGFLLPEEKTPLFNNDKVAVTRKAADKLATVFNGLIERGEERVEAQRFILQCVVALFAEDFDLLPRDFFNYLLIDCLEGASSYDLLGGLFRQMADPEPARGGRFQEVRYFNGGLFGKVNPMELTIDEVALLHEAATEHWSQVSPPIFGTLFQGSMDAERRHAIGAHFTSEADIQKIVRPTVVRPWQERIDGTERLKDLKELSEELQTFRVLDPACGSGNFLYVAYREIVHLHMEILSKIVDKYKEEAGRFARTQALRLPPTTNFFGIDWDPFATELTKVTLMLAKRIAVSETRDNPFSEQHGLGLEFEEPLPLDNLDANMVTDDALFCQWPEVDAVLGNPPFQSKNKIREELGPEYVNRLRSAFPEVPGRADFCVYWFRKTHDHISQGQRAGLVGTNTIRQNYSREGGLDYIVDQGGTITEAVSSQVWSGDAVVHVSIVNWQKGDSEKPKKLFKQLGDRLDSPWQVDEVDRISASLSPNFDVTTAKTLSVNCNSGIAFQGQTHGHAGFVLGRDEAEQMLKDDPGSQDVLFPYLTAQDFLTRVPPNPSRHVIDFGSRDVFESRIYSGPFARVEENVLPSRQVKADKEEKRNAAILAKDLNASVNRHHSKFLEFWWRLAYRRSDLIDKIDEMQRYIACARVTKRPVFVFVSSQVRPNDALQVFTLDDDYSFGILQSSCHWEWFIERCSTLKSDYRYTSNSVFDSFPWPQSPTSGKIMEVADRARDLRALRKRLIDEHSMSLRAIYRTLEQPGSNPLKQAHANLDDAVKAAYGFASGKSILEQLFELNGEVAALEEDGRAVQGPGIPTGYAEDASLFSDDCIFD